MRLSLLNAAGTSYPPMCFSCGWQHQPWIKQYQALLGSTLFHMVTRPLFCSAENYSPRAWCRLLCRMLRIVLLRVSNSCREPTAHVEHLSEGKGGTSESTCISVISSMFLFLLTILSVLAHISFKSLFLLQVTVHCTDFILFFCFSSCCSFKVSTLHLYDIAHLPVLYAAFHRQCDLSAKPVGVFVLQFFLCFFFFTPSGKLQ